MKAARADGAGVGPGPNPAIGSRVEKFGDDRHAFTSASCHEDLPSASKVAVW